MENFDPHAEKKIAKQAENMLRAAMRSKISSLGFKAHFNQPKVRLSDADAVAKTKIGQISNDNTNLKTYMNSLSLKMGKHGFIQHYGVNTTREDIKGRTRETPRTTHYNFKNHVFNLPAQDFIGKAVEQSGVVPFVLRSITEIRSQEIMVTLKNFIEKD